MNLEGFDENLFIQFYLSKTFPFIPTQLSLAIEKSYDV